jgi:hypothetical protein
VGVLVGVLVGVCTIVWVTLGGGTVAVGMLTVVVTVGIGCVAVGTMVAVTVANHC